MKKIIFVLVLAVINSTSYGQTPTAKADSIKRVEEQKAIVEIITKTPIQKFQEFVYSTKPTYDFYNDFLQYYQAFIRKEYEERLKQKQK